MTRHFLRLSDLTPDELIELLDTADELKRLRGMPQHPKPLDGLSVIILLEKASTRTRVSFVVGISELGGNPVTLASHELQLGRGEPLEDTARMLSRYAHAIVYRTSGHERLEIMVDHSNVPVINGLSDRHHPCQLLADLMTVREARRGRLAGIRVAWIGDGNNMAHSWIEAAGMVGLDLTLACPEGYEPDPVIIKDSRRFGSGSVRVVRSVDEAMRGADVVTTDVWASMGQEDESEKRKRAFVDYIVTEERMKLASSSAIFLHCLPAHRGEEVTDQVLESPASRVWDEAENRLHAQKALLLHLLGRKIPT